MEGEGGRKGGKERRTSTGSKKTEGKRILMEEMNKKARGYHFLHFYNSLGKNFLFSRRRYSNVLFSYFLSYTFFSKYLIMYYTYF